MDRTFNISGVHATPFAGEPAQDGQRTYIRSVRRFDLPLEILDHFTPKVGDVVSDGLYLYNVWKVQGPNIRHIPIVCTCPRLESLFSDYADIYEPSVRINEYNAVISDMSKTRSAVQCQLQPVTADEIDWLGKRGLKASFKMWLYGNEPIPFRSVVKINNINYKIVSIENMNRLDELMCLFLELNP